MSFAWYDPKANADFGLLAAAGVLNGVKAVAKFGRAPNGVQTTSTDVWSRADSTPTQQLWVAPTAARVHAIASSSTDDDGDPAGVGAHTVRVYGLTDWDSAETYEDITLNGTTDVNTTNSYVIIHRMQVTAAGDTNINAGTITATAATDSTVTAEIAIGQGQTQMAIYGIPSTKDFYATTFIAGVNDATANRGVDVQARVNPDPENQTTYRNQFDLQLVTGGTTAKHITFPVPRKVEGPAIIKLQATGAAADMDLSASFAGFLIDKPT